MASFKERLDQTTEFIEVLGRLWGEESVAHRGKSYSFKGVSSIEPPRGSPIPLLIGSEMGGSKMLRLVSKFADIANIGWNMDIDLLGKKLEELERLCREEGRDLKKILKSTNFDLLTGADEKEYRTKVAATEEKFRPRFGGMEPYLAKISRGVVGTPEECLEKVDRVKALGVDLIFFQPLDSPHTESVELFAGSLG
jgi:alkanesulfonate monooxygenase SsuD/methylene tetrahydromethanopterin reductase-like flavin-dependent oxidoreductase (luciferase family)